MSSYSRVFERQNRVVEELRANEKHPECPMRVAAQRGAPLIDRGDGVRVRHFSSVYNLILSTSSCVRRSFVRSYSLVVRGLSCAAISWACSSAPPFDR